MVTTSDLIYIHLISLMDNELVWGESPIGCLKVSHFCLQESLTNKKKMCLLRFIYQYLRGKT